MATNPFNLIPTKKTSPFNIPPAKPSVAGILDRALTGGVVGKTINAAQQFASLTPENRQLAIDVGTGKIKASPSQAVYKNTSLSTAPAEFVEAQKSPEAAAAYEKEQARRRLQYVRQNEGYFPAVGEAFKQYGQAKIESMQPVLEVADIAAKKAEDANMPILGGAVRGAKALYQSSVGATGEAARQLGEGNPVGAAFTYGMGKLMNSSPTGMVWTAAMEQKPVKEHVQPVLDAWNNELDTFFADQKNNPFSPIGSVLKESGKLLPYLLFDKVSRIPFKSKKTITLQDGKTFEIPVDRKWYAEAKKSVFNDILQLANDPAKFFKEKQFGLSIKFVGDEAEKGKMTSLKDMRTKLPRAGIEKPAPLPEDKTMMAVHNLNAGNLIFADKQPLELATRAGEKPVFAFKEKPREGGISEEARARAEVKNELGGAVEEFRRMAEILPKFKNAEEFSTLYEIASRKGKIPAINREAKLINEIVDKGIDSYNFTKLGELVGREYKDPFGKDFFEQWEKGIVPKFTKENIQTLPQKTGELRGNSPYSSIPQSQDTRVDQAQTLLNREKPVSQIQTAYLGEGQVPGREQISSNNLGKQDILPAQSQLENVSGNALETIVPTKQTLVNKVAELDAVKGEFDSLTEEIRTPIEAEIYSELANSKAGERYQLPDGTFTGMDSTFPKWIPYKNLRTSDLVQKVMKSMFSGKELKGKAGQLQEIVLAEIEKRMKPHELYNYYSEMRDYVKKLQTETAQEFRAGIRDIGNAEQLPFGVEGLEGAPPSAPTPGMLNLAKDVLKYKDISGFYGQMRDVYRNFKKVFGDRFSAVKKEILDPFDSAKGMFVEDQKRLLDDLDRVIVKELGIKKGSKESAAVMDYGEKLISFADLEKYFGTVKAEKIVAADRWFRNKYNELIDEVNNVRTRIYPGNPGKLVPKRQDYYRHFQELPQTLLGIRSIFEDPVAISPSLSGISEFTQPKTKWAGFMQKRKGNASVRDAVGGFLDYVPTATYAKWIDPQIAKFRGLAKTLAAATEDTKNLNNFIEFLQDFSNDLAGKTNAADRYIQKSIPGGRTTFRFIDYLNKHIKANSVLGNASSSIAQLFNIPQGIATAKQHSLKGMARTLGQIFHENKPMMESSFLKERYARSLFDKFETRYLAKAKNFAAWFTGVGDEIGTKFIWNSQYEKALAQGIENPVKYADDITREMVAGRGVGEVPLAQKSKLFQLVAPFQLEVTNLWYVMGDMVSKKDFAALATLFAANFLMNRAAEQIRGNPVVFDPIEATIEGIQRLKGERDWKVGAGKLTGRLAGEVLSNIPFGSDFAKYIFPENSRADIFGEADPTRFGQGLIPKVIQGGVKELPMLLAPFGGAQLKKTYGTVEALMNNGQVKSSSGKTTNFSIRNKSIPNITKGLLFGQYATEEGQKYLNRNKRTKSLFNIPSASGNNPFKLQSGNTSGNPFVLPKAR